MVEVEDHRCTYSPYRNQGTVCVKANGNDLDHRRNVTEARIILEYSFEYRFLGDEVEFQLAVLSGLESLKGMDFATAAD